MTRGMRKTAIVVAGLLIAACTRVGHVQRTEPIRTLSFDGSHKAVAVCVQQRLGGKVQHEFAGDRYVIYDSVKGGRQQGLTHYSVSVASAGPERGFAEWRVVRPSAEPGPSGRPAPPLSLEALRRYWAPVEECAAQAKRSQ